MTDDVRSPVNAVTFTCADGTAEAIDVFAGPAHPAG